MRTHQQARFQASASSLTPPGTAITTTLLLTHTARRRWWRFGCRATSSAPSSTTWSALAYALKRTVLRCKIISAVVAWSRRLLSRVCPTPTNLLLSRARSCWRASRHTLYDVMSVWWAGISHFVQVDKDPVAEAHKKEMEELRQV